MRKFSALPQYWGGVTDYGSHNTGQDRTGVCVRVCVHVLDCVFGNSENVQTVYKVCKLMYCAVVQMCVKIF